MSWEFAYCPACGADQVKVGGGVETLSCNECGQEWVEPRGHHKPKKSKDKKRGSKKK